MRRQRRGAHALKLGDGDDDDEEDDGNTADTICGSLRSFIQIIVVSRGRGDDENRERAETSVDNLHSTGRDQRVRQTAAAFGQQYFI